MKLVYNRENVIYRDEDGNTETLELYKIYLTDGYELGECVETTSSKEDAVSIVECFNNKTSEADKKIELLGYTVDDKYTHINLWKDGDAFILDKEKSVVYLEDFDYVDIDTWIALHEKMKELGWFGEL